MATKTNNNETINIFVFATRIAQFVNTNVRPYFDDMVELGALENGIKKNLNAGVEQVYKSKLSKSMQDYFVNKDIRQFIKGIFVKELEYEF